MRPLSGKRFAITVGWRTIAFIAVSFAYPYVVEGLQQLTKCGADGNGRECWTVAVLSGTVLRLAILALYGLSLVRPVWRRARTIGMPRFTGFLVPALLLLDWRFLTVIGSYWPITFDKGILNTGLPYFAILALLIMVLLAVAGEPTESRRALWRRRRVSCECGWLASAGSMVLGIVSVGLFLLWVAAMAKGAMTSPFAADAVRVGRAATIVALAAMVPFLWIVLAETLSRPPGPLEGQQR
ncbi:MAG: hypothetical protein KDJ88_16570 [Bauldia sp.]|nr:hypothetical protein [Bauldia sp.]